MEQVNWGIIGVGNVCEKKSGPAFYKIGHSSLVAIMRRDANKLKDFALRHNVPSYYTDAEQLINDPEVNAIYVATPPDSHKEYAIKALCAGKPVYVEKPMAMNYAECTEMIKASQESGQKLFVAYYRRALPYFLKVKELLEEDAIGRILTVNVRYMRPPLTSDLIAETHTWRVKQSVAGEGYFYDLAPHTLDILDFLLGEISEAKGFSQNLGHLYEVKDTFSAILQFESGVTGVGQWCFVTSGKSTEDSIVITGTKGQISFSTFSFSPIHLQSVNRAEDFAITPPEHIQQPLIQTIVDELRGKGNCPSTGISASRTSRVMDQILG
ncbi:MULTISPECIES: Gfo/Idh/MocA family oxidoreductase [unclassified Parabacteroides]|uniref:Gfo/Idh/MocA family protein n=1 Tax=unclassified Parabacteroides TaxID=2649774 RepID=UPI00247710DA|nr:MULTISPECIES: Gfo/Idh/MocA family oxidoreductase [unclassified Parabacteroides]